MCVCVCKLSLYVCVMQFTTGGMKSMLNSQNRLAVRNIFMQLQANTTTNMDYECLCMCSLHIMLCVDT